MSEVPEWVREQYGDQAYGHAAGFDRGFQAGREAGRKEADNAILWNTTCVSCAAVLEKAATAYADGERAGREAAARDIELEDGFETREEQAFAARIARGDTQEAPDGD